MAANLALPPSPALPLAPVPTIVLMAEKPANVLVPGETGLAIRIRMRALPRSEKITSPAASTTICDGLSSKAPNGSLSSPTTAQGALVTKRDVLVLHPYVQH